METVSKLQQVRHVFSGAARFAAVLAASTALVAGAGACSAPPEPPPAPPASSPAPSADPTTAPPAAARPLGWGPDQQDADRAAEAVAAMSTEKLAGQVLLPFYSGLDAEAHAATVERLHLAGSIIMGDNVPGMPDGQVDTTAMLGVAGRFNAAAQADGRSWPGMIGVDQEGGLVSRLRGPLTEWPAPMSYGAAGSAPLTGQAGSALAAELAGLGFNIDFAPTIDVTMGPADRAIGARSMSGDAGTAGGLGVAFSQGLLTGGLLPAVKHFPGHGSVTADSHESLPVLNGTPDQLRARDLIPFQAAIDAGLPMVMTGHLAVTSWDPRVPATLSKASYAELRAMGFQGVAVTDALNMGAITGEHPNDSAAPLALAAGADLLLMPASADAAHAAIVAAVKDGSLPAGRLAEAAQRVVTMMMWRGRTAGQPGAEPGAAPGSGAALSQTVSAAAITVLTGPCQGALVPGSVRVAGGSARDRERFTAAARDAGLNVGHGPLVALIGFGGSATAPETDGAAVAVALDAPWPLADTAAPTRIALYGRTPGAFAALAAVLTGAAAAPGKLPVTVGPHAPGSGCGGSAGS